MASSLGFCLLLGTAEHGVVCQGGVFLVVFFFFFHMKPGLVLPKDDCNHLSDYMYFYPSPNIYTLEQPLPHQHTMVAVRNFVLMILSFPLSSFCLSFESEPFQ